MSNHRYVIVATGEGASASAVDARPFLYEQLHNFLCCCGVPWRECKTPGVVGVVKLIDEPSEWEHDEGGEPFSFTSHGETGKISIYRISD